MKTNIYLLAKLMLMEKNIFTYNDIALKANISNKTIRNNIKTIADFLNTYKLNVKKSPGVGIKIIGDKLNKLQCYKDCEQKILTSNKIPSKIRQNIIAYLLLNGNRKVTISYLEKQLFITRPSIYNDLKFIETFFNKYNIHINKTRKNGFALVAGEKRIRHCLLDLSFKLNNDSIDNYTIVGQIIDFIKIIEINSKYYNHIKEFINQAAKASNTSITSSDLNRAIIFMIVGFERIKNHHYVTINPNTINKIKNKELAYFIKNNLSKLAKKFILEINDEETTYISAQLSAYMTASLEDLLKESSNPELLIKIINNFYNQLKTKIMLIDDSILKTNLFPFLEKTMQKFNFDYDCYNPNTPIIKKQYPELFKLATLINIEIHKYINTTLPDDALATITLLLASFQEKYITKIKCFYLSKEHPFKQQLTLNILNNNLANIDIYLVEDEESVDYNYDLILSTVDNLKFHKNVINIPAIINDEFILLLNEKLKEIRNQKRISFIR